MSAHPSDPNLNPKVAQSSATDPSEPASDGRSRLPADPVEDAAHALERTIRAELDAMEASIRELAARARRLGVGARAINGLKAATEVWSRDLEVIAGKVQEESPSVTAALLGKPPIPMTEIVPSEALVDAVREARRR